MEGVPPGTGTFHILILTRRNRGVGRDNGGSVCVTVDDDKLVVIVLVRLCVVGRVRRIVHARASTAGVEQIGVVEVLVLVGESELVPDFLIHHETAPGGCVVLGRVEIGVVHLDRALRDMKTADPDLGDTEPSGVAVGTVAHLDPSRGRPALPATTAARRHGAPYWILRVVAGARRDAPVRGRRGQIGTPVGCEVITERDGERVAGPTPMVASPRMGSVRGAGSDEKHSRESRKGEQSEHSRHGGPPPVNLSESQSTFRVVAGSRCASGPMRSCASLRTDILLVDLLRYAGCYGKRLS